MVEVYSVGGGEYLVNVFNAVAAWTGAGGYKSLIQVALVMGMVLAVIVVAFSAKLQREVANVMGVAHRVLDVSMLLLYLVLLYGCFGVILFRHTREGDAP